MRLRPSALPGQNLRRLRALLWPILETAGAAVAAWYLAKLLLSDRETGFAPIAAVICLGATIGQQRERALELIGGVVLGVLIADLLVRVLGTGPPQVGLMVVLAMSAAVLVGGGPMLMTEAGVSAIIIGSTAPSTLGLFPVRPIEALIGGAVAFGVHSLLFPPDPMLHVGRAANAVFSDLGRALEDLAAALDTGDRARAERALESTRTLDGDVRGLGDALALGRETARSAPLRWSARPALERQEEIGRHLDFAVRDTRVLARETVRYLRSGGSPVPDLAAAVGDLARALWALAASFDDPAAHEQPRSLALRAARRATEAMARHADLMLLEIAGQVRSTAADLARAAQAGEPDGDGMAEASTEEMLAEPPGVATGDARAAPDDASA
jgi:uncharacterized membrane protein YgaE (UPF0421/DUF939 family)